MKPVGLRERKKIRRREQIVRSAVWLFAEKGYDETTIADIAAMADVAPRTVLTYFATKEDIAMAPVVEIADRLLSAIHQRADNETTLDIFAAWLREELLNAGDPAGNLDMLRRMFEKNPKLTALQSSSTESAVAEVTSELAAEMNLSPDHVGPGLVVAAMMGIMTHVLSGPITGDRGQAVDVAFRFLAAGVDEMRGERGSR